MCGSSVCFRLEEYEAEPAHAAQTKSYKIPSEWFGEDPLVALVVQVYSVLVLGVCTGKKDEKVNPTTALPS